MCLVSKCSATRHAALRLGARQAFGGPLDPEHPSQVAVRPPPPWPLNVLKPTIYHPNTNDGRRV